MSVSEQSVKKHQWHTWPTCDCLKTSLAMASRFPRSLMEATYSETALITTSQGGSTNWWARTWQQENKGSHVLISSYEDSGTVKQPHDRQVDFFKKHCTEAAFIFLTFLLDIYYTLFSKQHIYIYKYIKHQILQCSPIKKWHFWQKNDSNNRMIALQICGFWHVPIGALN